MEDKMRASNKLKVKGQTIIGINELANYLRQDENKHNSSNAALSNEELINLSWVIISPFWSLKNLVAVNPLFGLSHIKFEDALALGSAHFIYENLPEPMSEVNRHTIKWCQAYFDKGQATISMPNRDLALFHCWKKLAQWDNTLTKSGSDQRRWLQSLPCDSQTVIFECLDKLNIPDEDRLTFLTLMLSTLPGWASYIKQESGSNGFKATGHSHMHQADYLALRLVITTLLWPEAKQLLDWHQKKANLNKIETSQVAEDLYRQCLLEKLTIPQAVLTQSDKKDAQFVFCIDVRSEPFRRAIEATGSYETYGFAGFFGAPVSIHEQMSGNSYAACPVLLKPEGEVVMTPSASGKDLKKALQYQKAQLNFVKLYQSAKYAFVSPFALAEIMGPFSGLWMTLRNLIPKTSNDISDKFKALYMHRLNICAQLDNISLDQQTLYALSALHLMGFTHNFAPLVVLCGHGSSTQNNAFASALDCGACGGRHGGNSAKVLAAILNNNEVRLSLAKEGIHIPHDTLFIAAEHNTTNDKVELFLTDGELKGREACINRLLADLERARHINSSARSVNLQKKSSKRNASSVTDIRSSDWAQVRPEWGLARNASFIVAPRELTKNIDLEGRSFLHSYDWQQDPEGQSLRTILTAPMVVASWINQQYLISTANNVAFGAGNKITSNITGKIGVMQGNCSDLMHGLPLQSVYKEDGTPYHEPLRLLTVVHAPKDLLNKVIESEVILKQLFGNGWVNLVCIDPKKLHVSLFKNNNSWESLANE